MTEKDDPKNPNEAAGKPEADPETDGTGAAAGPEEAAPPANENGADAEASPWADGDGEKVAAELADTKDKLLRALAEVENVRRRAQRDREEASRYAIANFAREMLGVADNLRRALDAATPEARAGSEAVNNLAVGVEMTEQAMLQAFDSVGIKPIEAVGQTFDPNRHEALYEVPDSGHPAGTVAQEVARGYMLHDRLLRPAKVGVARGAAPAPAGGQDGDGATEADEGDPRGSATYEARVDAESHTAESGGKLDEKL